MMCAFMNDIACQSACIVLSFKAELYFRRYLNFEDI